jgi:hypothetical protein
MTKNSILGKKGSFYSIKNKRKFFYRSSWEMKYMKYLEDCPDILTYQYESLRLPYFYRNKRRWYIPDFVVGNKIIEIKPKYFVNRRRNLAKFAIARIYCAANNMSFEIITEEELKKIGVI